MDVPSWHPANQNSDAVRRLAMSSGADAKRTEFKVVDTSTEAERQQVVAKEENVVLGGGRGLLDPSDRQYLLEQTQLELQAKSWEQLERETALQSFRSNALKVQAHKAPMLDIPVVGAGGGKKALLAPEKKTVVVIKVKKRQAAPAENGAKAKKTKKSPFKLERPARSGNQDEGPTPAQTAKVEITSKKTGGTTTAKAVSKSPATTLLLQDYSSSSDEE